MTLKKLLKNQEFPKKLFDKNRNEIYCEYSNGDWSKSEFDSNNNLIYRENSNGYWFKRECDSNNNRIYWEDSNGTIDDNRPKEVKRLTHKEICELIGYNVEIIKEKE